MDGSIDPYQNTTEGAEISFMCSAGYATVWRMAATCASNGMWTPDPGSLTCICEYLLSQCIHTAVHSHLGSFFVIEEH